jgi:hypothetical protein
MGLVPLYDPSEVQTAESLSVASCVVGPTVLPLGGNEPSRARRCVAQGESSQSRGLGS